MLLAAGREVVSKTSAYNITKLSYRVEARVSNKQIINYLLLNDVSFNFHVKRNLSLQEMVYINGKDSWLESIF